MGYRVKIRDIRQEVFLKSLTVKPPKKVTFKVERWPLNFER
jgi:hypothetical protein